MSATQHVIPGANQRSIFFDVSLCDSPNAPLIIFLHGFKGFKDWGQWPLLDSAFNKLNCSILRLNFSHNGVTPQNPIDFVDLSAFGENTFSKELEDVKRVLEWVAQYQKNNSISFSKIMTVGHSRGGAIALISANENPEIDGVCSWNGVATLERFSEQELAIWKKQGVIHVPNARTNQQMPLNFSLAQDFLDHSHKYSLHEIANGFTKPYLIIQGDADETVPLKEGESLHQWYKNSELLVVPNMNHSLNGGHPYTANELPEATQLAVERTAQFLNEL